MTMPRTYGKPSGIPTNLRLGIFVRLAKSLGFNFPIAQDVEKTYHFGTSHYEVPTCAVFVHRQHIFDVQFPLIKMFHQFPKFDELPSTSDDGIVDGKWLQLTNARVFDNASIAGKYSVKYYGRDLTISSNLHQDERLLKLFFGWRESGVRQAAAKFDQLLAAHGYNFLTNPHVSTTLQSFDSFDQSNLSNLSKGHKIIEKKISDDDDAKKLIGELMIATNVQNGQHQSIISDLLEHLGFTDLVCVIKCHTIQNVEEQNRILEQLTNSLDNDADDYVDDFSDFDNLRGCLTTTIAARKLQSYKASVSQLQHELSTSISKIPTAVSTIACSYLPLSVSPIFNETRFSIKL